MNEFLSKQEKLHKLMESKKLDAIFLQRTASFAWATCGGGSFVGIASTTGAASLIITLEKNYLVTNSIEAPRLDKEEYLATQGWQFEVNPWYEPQAQIARLLEGKRVGSDFAYKDAVDISGDIMKLRTTLLPEELERFRMVGKNCAAAMEETIFKVQPGQTEYEIAGMLASACLSRQLQPIVNLIATDERIFQYRHPLPTGKKMEKYAMVVLSGRQRGLVCSITRLVHFGKLETSLRQKMQAVEYVDGVYHTASRPGATLESIFLLGKQAYADSGYANEWQMHHQGGLCSYEPRENLGKPGATDMVVAGQAYAWNPSITGVKSEDTILVLDNHNEVICPTPNLPTIDVTVNGMSYSRPAIFEV